MVESMKENTVMIRSTAMEFINGQMAENTMETGLEGSSMGWESTIKSRKIHKQIRR